MCFVIQVLFAAFGHEFPFTRQFELIVAAQYISMNVCYVIIKEGISLVTIDKEVLRLLLFLASRSVAIDLSSIAIPTGILVGIDA